MSLKEGPPPPKKNKMRESYMVAVNFYMYELSRLVASILKGGLRMLFLTRQKNPHGQSLQNPNFSTCKCRKLSVMIHVCSTGVHVSCLNINLLF